MPEDLDGKPKRSYDNMGILVKILKNIDITKYEKALPKWMEPSPLFFEAIKEIKSNQGRVYYKRNSAGEVKRHVTGDPYDMDTVDARYELQKKRMF